MAEVERTFVVQAPAFGPAMAAAMIQAGDLIRAAWMEELGDHADTGAAMRSLQDQDALQYPFLSDPMMVAVVSTEPQTDWLEEGRAGFHMPDRIDPGKWKVTKDGKRYLNIPFRHTSPVKAGGGASGGRMRTQMPADVYALASQLEDGARLTVGSLSAALEGGDATPLGAELFKQGKSYSYYREIFGGQVPDHLPGGYTWRAGKFEGLQRNTRETPGGGRHTEYMTFRTITPDSEGWYIPPTPGYHLAAHALDAAAPAIEQLFEAAAASDAVASIVDATRGLFE
ncbi:MAG: hypothetical protein ABI629_10420 [bacterium]